MDPKSQPLPRSAFAAFCAFALAASMALPFMGASKSYAEEAEAPAVEGAQTEPLQDEPAQAEADASEVAPASEEGAAVLPEESEQSESLSADSGEEAKPEKKLVPEAGTAVCYVKDWKALSFPTGPNGFTGYDDKDLSYEGIAVPVTVVGDRNAIAFIGGTVGSGLPHSLSYKDGTLVWKGLGSPYDNADVFVTTDKTLTGGFLEGIIPLPCVKGQTIVSVTLTVNSVDDEGYVTKLTVSPVYGTASEDDVQPVVVEGSTGITAIGALAGPNIPEGADVNVTARELEPGDPDYEKLKDATMGGIISGVYDISMFVDGDEIHDGFGKLTLTMPVDSAYNGHWVTIHHLHNDGSISSETTIVKDGTVTFTVEDLSSFALEIGDLAEEEVSASTDEPKGSVLPPTGDSAATLGLVAVAGAVLSGAGAFVLRRKGMRG